MTTNTDYKPCYDCTLICDYKPCYDYHTDLWLQTLQTLIGTLIFDYKLILFAIVICDSIKPDLSAILTVTICVYR